MSTPDSALTPYSDLRPESPSPRHHRRAEILFRLGRYPEAVADYDVAARGGDPHDEDSCWERGLALYYAGDYKAGAAQFERYHRVGATDIENGLWYFLCVAEAEGLAKAREAMFDYPRKRGAPFPALLALYLGEGGAEAVLESVEGVNLPPAERRDQRFFAHYYLAKYHELSKDLGKARREIALALEQPIPHFMYACAEADAERLEASIADNAPSN